MSRPPFPDDYEDFNDEAEHHMVVGGFGPCSVCGEQAMVRVQSGGGRDAAACTDHLDEVLRAAFAPVRDAIRRANQ